jgi:DNA-binding transcriptional ArsR family regulator
MLVPVAEPLACVGALKALGEETRVRIVGLLMVEPLGVGEISRRLRVSAYNVSKHLRILREAGLLDVAKDGRRRLYALPDAIKRQGASTSGHVLDLGCCSFQFDRSRSSSRSPSPRAHPLKSHPAPAAEKRHAPRSSTTPASRAR